MILSTIVIVVSVGSISVASQNLKKYVVSVAMFVVVVVVIEKIGKIVNDFIFWVRCSTK